MVVRPNCADTSMLKKVTGYMVREEKEIVLGSVELAVLLLCVV